MTNDVPPPTTQVLAALLFRRLHQHNPNTDGIQLVTNEDVRRAFRTLSLAATGVLPDRPPHPIGGRHPPTGEYAAPVLRHILTPDRGRRRTEEAYAIFEFYWQGVFRI